MQLYYFEIGNTLKLSVFDIEYRLLDYLVARMTISRFNRRMPNCTTVVQTTSDLFELEI